jgi:hypothetical protein
MRSKLGTKKQIYYRNGRYNWVYRGHQKQIYVYRRSRKTIKKEEYMP